MSCLYNGGYIFILMFWLFFVVIFFVFGGGIRIVIGEIGYFFCFWNIICVVIKKEFYVFVVEFF